MRVIEHRDVKARTAVIPFSESSQLIQLLKHGILKPVPGQRAKPVRQFGEGTVQPQQRVQRVEHSRVKTAPAEKLAQAVDTARGKQTENLAAVIFIRREQVQQRAQNAEMRERQRRFAGKQAQAVIRKAKNLINIKIVQIADALDTGLGHLAEAPVRRAGAVNALMIEKALMDSGMVRYSAPVADKEILACGIQLVFFKSGHAEGAIAVQAVKPVQAG